ncbi:MAG: hypothetical protein K0R00_1361 [Herbinix sp.]|jgi:hypothetical protein|nr:hypothetical protein [Herbinix sp.]
MIIVYDSLTGLGKQFAFVKLHKKVSASADTFAI